MTDAMCEANIGRPAPGHQLCRGERDRTNELEQRLRGCLTSFAAAAHDLRSPLTGLTLWVETLAALEPRLMAGADEEAIALFRMGVANLSTLVRRSVDLVDDALDVSLRQAGHELPLARAAVDLVALARQVLQGLPDADDTGHVLQLVSPHREVWGWWDGDRLARVLDNLLTNAIKYSRPRQPITVRVAQEQDADAEEWAILQVDDRGIGIPAADMGRVFEAYQRGRNVPPSISGVGLGLWLSRGGRTAWRNPQRCQSRVHWQHLYGAPAAQAAQKAARR